MDELSDSSPETREGEPITYRCATGANYLMIAVGALFALGACVPAVASLIQGEYVGVFFGAIFALVGGGLICFAVMRLRNASATLYEDRLEWTDWRGTVHSCENKDIRLILRPEGDSTCSVMRSMTGESLVLTNQFKDYQELEEQLRRRTDLNSQDKPPADVRQLLVPGVLLLVCGFAAFILVGASVSQGEINVKGGGAFKSGEPGFIPLLALYGVLGLGLMGLGVSLVVRSRAKP